MLFLLLGAGSTACGQVFDSFDGGRSRMRLGGSDCGAKIAQQGIDIRNGRDGSPSERVVISAGNGTYAHLIYPIEPAAVIDEVVPRLWVRATAAGCQIGVRVAFPKARVSDDGEEPLRVVLRGGELAEAGRWQPLTMNGLTRRLQQKMIALRRQYGSEVDLSAPYVDAVALNAYTGPGVATVWIDDLSVEGHVGIDRVPQPPKTAERDELTGEAMRFADAFPVGQIARIVEYRGEAFEWLKSLGFEVVLLGRPPTPDQLREAEQTELKLLAPVPPYPYALEGASLDPVVGWYLGTALDHEQLAPTDSQVAVAERLPEAWRRPLLAAPVEDWDRFAGRAEMLVLDLPPEGRGLLPQEEVEMAAEVRRSVGRPVAWAAGIETSPPAGLLRQWNAAADAIGTSGVDSYGWHGIWLQTMRALEWSPRAVVYRSSSPLDSGRTEDAERSSALRMVNALVEALEPLVAGATPGAEIPCHDAPYRAVSLARGPWTLVLAGPREQSWGAIPAVGTGRVLNLDLPPAFRSATATRLTGATPRRLEIEPTASGGRISIVSPDLCEAVLITGHPDANRDLLARMNRSAATAAVDRMQLVAESLMRTRAAWEAAETGGAVPRSSVPRRRLAAAAGTLADAEPFYRNGQFGRASESIRRADAWELRCRAQLTAALQPRFPGHQSLPTLLAPGAMNLHLVWPPALGGGRWEAVPLDEDFEDVEAMSAAGWTHDRRLEERMATSIEVPSDAAAGGALRVRTWPRSNRRVPGGYAGTALRIRSPEITVADEGWVRIACRVRVPMGFTGPEQGLLVYDSVGGAELGIRVAAQGEWLPVRLYRFVPRGGRLQVRFELAGAGEAWIDDLHVEQWKLGPVDDPEERPTLPTRAISP